MKLAIYRKDLVESLNRVIKVVPSVKVADILSYVRVSVDNDRINFTATDLSNFISVSASCKSSESGVGLFPAHQFLAALKTLKQDAVAVSFQDGTLKLRAGTSGWNWKTHNPDMFPSIPVWEQSKVSVVEVVPFVESCKKVKAAVAVNSFSKNLEQIGFIGGKLLASDGARFHQSKVSDLDINVALPPTFVDDLVHILPLLGKKTFELGSTTNGDALVAQCGDVVLSTKTKTDQFPDLNKAFLIPSMSNYQFVKLNKAELIDAIHRVRIVADSTSRLINMRLSVGSSQMVITAQQLNETFATDEVTANFPPHNRDINLNVDFLLQGLAVFDEDVIEFRLGNDAKNKPSTVLITQGDNTVVLNQLRAL